MRFSFIFLICGFLPVAAAIAQDMPFSERAKQVLQMREISAADIERLDGFVARLDARQHSFKKKRNFINFLVDETHRDVFSSYEQLSSLENLVSKGSYNCLTGSVFFALLLERYGLAYTVIETNYHMFVMIEDEDRKYLLDATDRIHGFETNAVLVEKRLIEYKANNQEHKNNTVAFQFDLFNQVSLAQLGGLLFFNRSVEAYNRQDFVSAVDYLYDASLNYRSVRIIEMAKLIEVHLQELPVTSSHRQKISRIRQLESVVIASN